VIARSTTEQPARGIGVRRLALSAPHILAVLVITGVLLRLWMIGVSPLDPRFSNADDGDYYRRALHFAITGQYLDDAWLIRPPLHVFFFAIWLRLALLLGQPQLGVLFVQLAQTAVAGLTILAGYGVARRLLANERAGLLFAAFLACWYPFVEQPSVLFSELFYLALFFGHVWFLLRYDTSGRLPDLAGSGIALGAAALTRSPALYSLVFVWLWLAVRAWLRRNSAKRPAMAATLRAALVVAIGCLAIVLPWTARNYALYGQVIPVDTLGQINLWLDLDAVDRRVANIEVLRGMPQAERAPYALAQARAILARDPWRPFEAMWPTFQHSWKAQFVEDFFVKQSFYTRPLRETAWLGLLGDVVWLVFVVAGLIGLARPAREGWHNRLFVLAWLAYSFVTVLVFHVEPRYLLPIWALLGLYGAGTLADWGRNDLARPRRMWAYRVIQAALVAAFALLLLSYRDYGPILARGFARERAAVAGERAYRAGQYDLAANEFRAALQAQPGFIDAEVSLALALGAQGKFEAGQAVLTRGGSRRSELVYGALARDAGQLDEARSILPRYEAIAGEDVQRWALEWWRPPATRAVTLGGGLDLGYIHGFLESEQDAAGTYRWLGGGGRAVLPLPEPLEAGASLALRLSGGPRQNVPLDIQFAAGPTQRIVVQGGAWRTYIVAVPPELAGATTLDVRLRAPTFVPAQGDVASQDARALGLMVGEVRVQ
jgi:4-amino-4-deoxy-L-arabinose transferase-like glycosyltransferase